MILTKLGKLLPYFIIEKCLKCRDCDYNDLNVEWKYGRNRTKCYNAWEVENGTYLIIEKSKYIENKIKQKEAEIKWLQMRKSLGD